MTSSESRADLEGPIASLAALLRREGMSEPSVERALAEIFNISEDAPLRGLRRILRASKFAQELRRDLEQTELSARRGDIQAEEAVPVPASYPRSERREEGIGQGQRSLGRRDAAIALWRDRTAAADLASTLQAEKARDGLQFVQDFVVGAVAANSLSDLEALLDQANSKLGFDQYAVIEHKTAQSAVGERISLGDCPIDWMSKANPVLRAVERSPSGFRWDRLDSLVEMTEIEAAYMARLSRAGISDGFTVPNHIPGTTFGSCHFMTRTGHDFPDRSISAVQALGNFAFEAARRVISISPGDIYLEHAPLSDRQRECLLFVARGKSDSVIADLLAIRPKTVTEHIEAAKRRYAVATRSQLLVRALFRSEICFTEIIDSAGRSDS